MKWEILKGSEKDFEFAPEWATKLLRDNNDSKKSFVGELDGVSLVAEQVSPHSWWKFNDGYVGKIIAERRPITEPDVNQQVTTEWSGDGLPPVGAKVMSPSGAAIIDFVGKDVIFYTNSDGQWSVRCDGVHGRLSPLQPENVAREEAISEMVESLNPTCNHLGRLHETCTILYDAGYRKVE